MNSEEKLIEYKTYPDGTGYYQFDEFYANRLKNRLLAGGLTFRIGSYQRLWQLVQLHSALYPIIKGRKIDVTIPWLLEGQADRKEEGKTFGLYPVLKILSMLQEIFNITVYHPHNSDAVSIATPSITCLPFSEDLFNKAIETMEGTLSEKTCILAPDAGAYKWLAKIDWDFDLLSCSKVRKARKPSVLVPDGVKNYDEVIIIDDISIYGGTFKRIAQQLPLDQKKHLIVSHMPVQMQSAELYAQFDSVHTTNSVHDQIYVEVSKQPFAGRVPVNLTVHKLFEDDRY